VANGVSSQIAIKGSSRNVGVSALAAVLVAATPKCPLCWMALTSALGVGSVVNSAWLQPLAVALLFTSLGVLLARARRRRSYGPFFLGLLAAVAMCVSKFRLDYDVGVYLSGATLIAASVWNAVPGRQAAGDARCHC
jgi:hypothetical protein